MKSKIWLMALLVIFFVLFIFMDSAGATETEKDFKELITAQNKLCQNLKAENKRISAMLDEILKALSEEQDTYREMKKFRNLAKNAENLLSENERLLKDAPNEKDKKILYENLSKTGDNFIKVSFIHRILTNLLLIMFGPRFGQESPPPETVI